MPDPKVALPVEAVQRGTAWVVVDADGSKVAGGGPFRSRDVAARVAARVNKAWEGAKADRKANGSPEVTQEAAFEEKLHPRGRTGEWVRKTVAELVPGDVFREDPNWMNPEGKERTVKSVSAPRRPAPYRGHQLAPPREMEVHVVFHDGATMTADSKQEAHVRPPKPKKKLAEAVEAPEAPPVEKKPVFDPEWEARLAKVVARRRAKEAAEEQPVVEAVEPVVYDAPVVEAVVTGGEAPGEEAGTVIIEPEYDEKTGRIVRIVRRTVSGEA